MTIASVLARRSSEAVAEQLFRALGTVEARAAEVVADCGNLMKIQQRRSVEPFLPSYEVNEVQLMEAVVFHDQLLLSTARSLNHEINTETRHQILAVAEAATAGRMGEIGKDNFTALERRVAAITEGRFVPQRWSFMSKEGAAGAAAEAGATLLTPHLGDSVGARTLTLRERMAGIGSLPLERTAADRLGGPSVLPPNSNRLGTPAVPVDDVAQRPGPTPSLEPARRPTTTPTDRPLTYRERQERQAAAMATPYVDTRPRSVQLEEAARRLRDKPNVAPAPRSWDRPDNTGYEEFDL